MTRFDRVVVELNDPLIPTVMGWVDL